MPFADVVFSYCPKCGARSFQRQGPGILACSACKLRFFTNVAAAVTAVISDPEGRILVVRRSKEPGRGLLDLPGGFVEPGETAEDAIRREAREELGIEITPARLLATAPNEYEFEGITYRTLDLVYECLTADLGRVAAREEISETLFKALEDIAPQEFAFASVRRVLLFLRKHEHRTESA